MLLSKTLRKWVYYIMKVNNFVYGDTNRIFVNTDMGCNADCKYCYLSSLEIVHGERKISASKAIELVQNLEYYVPGEKGSIISIGCYSECMDKTNIADTIALVKHFVEKGNFVQLATKKRIERSFFNEIIKYNNVRKYLWIYVSMPVIKNYNLVERGTDSPQERVINFELCKEYDIHSALYIKPYLAGITNQNIVQYCELVYKYNIPVVVGEMLSIEPTSKEVLVGERRLYEHPAGDIDKFIAQLREKTKVYLHSVECVR